MITITNISKSYSQSFEWAKAIGIGGVQPTNYGSIGTSVKIDTEGYIYVVGCNSSSPFVTNTPPFF